MPKDETLDLITYVMFVIVIILLGIALWVSPYEEPRGIDPYVSTTTVPQLIGD